MKVKEITSFFKVFLFHFILGLNVILLIDSNRGAFALSGDELEGLLSALSSGSRKLGASLGPVNNRPGESQKLVRAKTALREVLKKQRALENAEQEFENASEDVDRLDETITSFKNNDLKYEDKRKWWGGKVVSREYVQLKSELKSRSQAKQRWDRQRLKLEQEKNVALSKLKFAVGTLDSSSDEEFLDTFCGSLSGEKQELCDDYVNQHFGTASPKAKRDQKRRGLPGDARGSSARRGSDPGSIGGDDEDDGDDDGDDDRYSVASTSCGSHSATPPFSREQLEFLGQFLDPMVLAGLAPDGGAPQPSAPPERDPILEGRLENIELTLAALISRLDHSGPFEPSPLRSLDAGGRSVEGGAYRRTSGGIAWEIPNKKSLPPGASGFGLSRTDSATRSAGGQLSYRRTRGGVAWDVPLSHRTRVRSLIDEWEARTGSPRSPTISPGASKRGKTDGGGESDLGGGSTLVDSEGASPFLSRPRGGSNVSRGTSDPADLDGRGGVRSQVSGASLSGSGSSSLRSLSPGRSPSEFPAARVFPASGSRSAMSPSLALPSGRPPSESSPTLLGGASSAFRSVSASGSGRSLSAAPSPIALPSRQPLVTSSSGSIRGGGAVGLASSGVVPSARPSSEPSPSVLGGVFRASRVRLPDAPVGMSSAPTSVSGPILRPSPVVLGVEFAEPRLLYSNGGVNASASLRRVAQSPVPMARPSSSPSPISLTGGTLAGSARALTLGAQPGTQVRPSSSPLPTASGLESLGMGNLGATSLFRSTAAVPSPSPRVAPPPPSRGPTSGSPTLSPRSASPLPLVSPSPNL